MLITSTPLIKKVNSLKLSFPISWFLSGIAMFALFYAWHGIFLNDISKISYPKNIFFTAAVLVYIVISYVLVALFNSKAAIELIRNNVVRGLACGTALGVTILLLTLVVGVSFSTQITLKSILFDLSWQAVEQGIGGVIVGLVHSYFRYSVRIEKH